MKLPRIALRSLGLPQHSPYPQRLSPRSPHPREPFHQKHPETDMLPSPLTRIAVIAVTGHGDP
jgi:hypothetical protein